MDDSTAFSAADRQALLALPGVGEGVLRRLELAGVHSLDALAGLSVQKALAELAATTACDCWVSSKKAQRLVERLVQHAQAQKRLAPSEH